MPSRERLIFIYFHFFGNAAVPQTRCKAVEILLLRRAVKTLEINRNNVLQRHILQLWETRARLLRSN